MSSTETLPFPEGFLFGAATSAHQVEGGYLEDGKKMNIWDHLTNNVYPHMEDGNEACKSYPDLYKEDVKLLKDAGFDVYRFSMSWARLLPNGEYKKGAVNQKGVDYYNNLIDELQKNGIEPVVTVYHWDLPHKFQDGFGGWTNPTVIDFLVDYAYLLFSLFGHKVKRWITINEPTLILHGYENGGAVQIAPAKSLGSPANYIVVHNLLKAHAKIYHLYDKEFRPKQNGQIGITLVGSSYRPKNPDNPEDVKAALEAYAFYVGLFANPIYSKEGNYPKLVRDMVYENSVNKEGRRRSRLPEFTPEEIESLKGSSDFFGLNHYMTELCTRKTAAEACKRRGKPVRYHYRDRNPLDSFGEDLMVINEPLEDPEPLGFREILNYIKDNYQNPPIFVTENGYGVDASTWQWTDELIHDRNRCHYYDRFLSALLKAIHEDGCNVIGYTTWALLDNFEWSRGYAWKYGIVHVDFEDENRKRTPKDSHAHLKQIIKNRYLDII